MLILTQVLGHDVQSGWLKMVFVTCCCLVSYQIGRYLGKQDMYVFALKLAY